jgi:hypothetical protein
MALLTYNLITYPVSHLQQIILYLKQNAERWYNVSRMKQQGERPMKADGLRLDELAELAAWEGYEFWSAQLEAEMESLDEGRRAERFGFIQLERKAGQPDVLPF